MPEAITKVLGLADLEKALLAIPEKDAKPALRTGLRRAGQVVQRSAQSKAPLYVGRNKKSVVAGFLISQINVFARIYSQGALGSLLIVKVGIGKAFYGKFIEFGWRVGANIRASRFRGHFLSSERGGKEIQRHEFMTPAFEENKTRLVNIIIQEVKSAISRIQTRRLRAA